MPDVIPGQSTLGQMRTLVAFETDQPTPTDSTDVTLDDYDRILNRSYRELIGLLVDEFQDYYVNPDNGNPYSFVTTANQYLYALPNDFFKLLGMDCLWQPGQIQSAVTMRPFMQLERNRFQGLGVVPVTPWVPRYKISGNQIWLQPMPPPAGLQILVRYVPLQPDLTDRATISFTGAATPGDYFTIAALPSIPQGPPVNGVLPALTPQIKYLAIPNTQQPIISPTQIEFHVGNSAADSAANLAAAMNLDLPTGFPLVPWGTTSWAQNQNTATVSANAGVLTIQLIAPLAIIWTSVSQSGTGPVSAAALSPLPQATQSNPYGAFCNFCSTLNGFDELVIVDAAIKVKQKQQSPEDVAILSKRKAELLQRIRTEANNRNAAQNARVTNVRRNRGIYGGGLGGPYGGGYGGY